MEWLLRVMALLFGGRSDERDDDDRRQPEVAMGDRMRDDSTPMNASGSPDDRDEADDDSGDDGGDGGGDDGGGDD